LADTDRLWDFERGVWLDGIPHCERHLAPDARMVFPEPAGILDADGILQGLDGAPRWEAVTFEAQHAAQSGDTVVLSYRATAHRPGDAPYRVLCSSTYVRQGGGWKLLMHQHTPRD
jgi:hypothetical protein